jgi:LPXTG-motif cell wall-anchored protein
LSKALPHWLARALFLPWPAKIFAFGEKFMPQASQSPWLGVIMFLLLASSLYVFARKKLE